MKKMRVGKSKNQGDRFLIHSDEEYLVVTRKTCIFALYNVNKHSMLRQKREKNGTGICHVMQGKESKTCPSDSPRVRKDFVKPDGTCVIIKPDTPSGHAAAAQREKLMQDNKFKTQTIYYNPSNPAYQPGSPTYIGPAIK